MTREESINGLIHIAAGYWDENSMTAITEAITILESQPSLPEDLDEAAERYAQFYDQDLSDENGNFVNGCGDLRVAFIAGAEYQRKQDQSLIELAEDHSMLAGMNKMKEEMMKEAIHYVVQDDLDSHGASYNIPFIRIGTTALKPKGIGVGDKVKVIVIPEE